MNLPRLCALAAASAAAAAGLRAAPALAMRSFETLVYHVSWAVLPGVGEIRVTALPATDPTGAPLLRIVSTTQTRGLAYLLLPFEARSESLFDTTNGRLLWLGETSRTRTRDRRFTVSFDYRDRTATFADAGAGRPPRPLPMPPGDPTDLITCLLLARTWNLRPGQVHDALVLFTDDFYELTVHALGYERIWTPLGDMDTLVLEPRMDRTPPKGMFKRGSTVRVWISRDARRLPVQFEVHFNIGTGLATLAEYHQPGPDR